MPISVDDWETSRNSRYGLKIFGTGQLNNAQSPWRPSRSRSERWKESRRPRRKPSARPLKSKRRKQGHHGSEVFRSLREHFSRTRICASGSCSRWAARRLPLGGQVPGARYQRPESGRVLRLSQGSIFGFFDLFAGGNIRRFTIFALGIMPYITASIIPAIAHGGRAHARKTSEGGRTSAAAKCAVDALPDDHSFGYPICHHRYGPSGGPAGIVD